MTSLAVIMVTYNTGAILLEAIDAVLADKQVSTLVLVDNGNSAADRARYYARIQNEPRVRVAAGHGNIGFGRACNYGAGLTRSNYILFLNPDAVLRAGAVSKLLEARAKRAEPWIIGGLLIDEDGVEQRGSRRAALTPLTLFSGFNRHTDALPQTPSAQPTVSGACMLMSRAGFNAIGGFDAAYFLHVEDIDICARARAAGGDVYIAPQARIVHEGASSQVSSIFVNWQKYKSFLRYFWTRGPSARAKVSALLLTPVITAVMIARTLKELFIFK